MRQSDEMRERAEAASSVALDAGYYIHSLIGPGALEPVYEAFLAEEIRFRGLPARAQVPISVSHRGITLPIGYRIDLLVDEALVVEVKATLRPHPIHHAQLVSYLRLSGYRMGLLMNFHVEHLRDGIRRVLNDYEESSRRARRVTVVSFVLPSCRRKERWEHEGHEGRTTDTTTSAR